MSDVTAQDEVHGAAISAMDDDHLADEFAEIVSRCVDAGEVDVDPDYEMLLSQEVSVTLQPLIGSTRSRHLNKQSNIAELEARVRSFCEARDWDQFHGPKDLAIGLATEAGELLEIFRFLSDEQCAAKLANPESRQAIENELADVLFFLLRFAQRFDIDLDDALAAKMKLNAERYPVEKSRGKNLKYGDL